MTVVEEVEALKLRLENLSGIVPESDPTKLAFHGWFRALAAQAQLVLIVFHLHAIIEAKTGSKVDEEQELVLLLVAQLREAAATAEQLSLHDSVQH